MKLRGVVRTAELQEYPPGTDEVELILKIQGVGPGQPRVIVIPFTLLVANDSLDPEEIAGRAFDAETDVDAIGRHVVSQIAFASRVLRPSD